MAATLFGKIFILVFGLGAFAFGLGAALLMVNGIVTSVKNRRALWRSRRWPVAQGHVIRAKEVSGDGGASDVRPVVEYKFEVNGTQYRGRRLDFDDGATYGFSEVEKILQQYEKGAPVQVYYDPDDPQQCALQRKQVGGGCGAAFAAVGLTLLSAFLFMLGVESLRDLFPK